MMPQLRKQGGQMIVEAVLIIVLFMGATMLVTNYFKDNDVLKKLIHGPWQNLAGMLQNGIWGTPEKTVGLHPNSHKRHVVITGEAP